MRTNGNLRLLIGAATTMLACLFLAGCAQTTAPEPNIIQRANGEKPAPPPSSGFLGADYSLMQPPAEGSDQEAMLRYINPSGNWSSYNKIMIAPVTFWASDDSKVSAADQQALCNYFYTVLEKQLGTNFTLVDQPAPGVMKFSAAFTGASSAVPVLRTVSLVVPQARALSIIKMAATGTYAFVGSAQGEAKLNDSVSGELLAAWADKRVGGASLKNVDVFTWGDANNAMNYWADGLGKRLVTLGVQQSGTAASNP
ncbi:MAG: DUF3313 domain-containing protein [Candidatus Binataceae bacterium]